MGMSPSGAPGLLIVIMVVFGGISLFVPKAYHHVLFVPLVVALGLVFVFAIYAQFRTPPSSSHGPDLAEAGSTRWLPYLAALRAALAIVIAVAFLVAGFLLLYFDIGEVVQVWLLAAIVLIVLTGVVVFFVSSVARRVTPKPPGAA